MYAHVNSAHRSFPLVLPQSSRIFVMFSRCAWNYRGILCGVERGPGLTGRVQFCSARSGGKFGVFGWFAPAVAQVQQKQTNERNKHKTKSIKHIDGEHRDGVFGDVRSGFGKGPSTKKRRTHNHQNKKHVCDNGFV